MAINITRPVVTVVASPSGKKFGIEWSHASWTQVHQHLVTFDDADDATEFGKTFLNDFNAEADDIEANRIAPHNIARTLREHGLIRSKRKVTTGRFGQ